MPKQMIDKRSWQEFRDAGLIWWVNRVLHLFGWAIVLELNADGSISGAYPARCKFRGFDTTTESEGFEKLTRHLYENSDRLISDLDE